MIFIKYKEGDESLLLNTTGFYINAQLYISQFGSVESIFQS